MYTSQQLELKAHIDAANAKFIQDCKERGSTFYAYPTNDLDHWAEFGVFTIEQFEFDMLLSTYSDCYKDAYGIRPRISKDITFEQLKKAMDSLPVYDPADEARHQKEYLEYQAQQEEADRQEEAEEQNKIQDAYYDALEKAASR